MKTRITNRLFVKLVAISILSLSLSGCEEIGDLLGINQKEKGHKPLTEKEIQTITTTNDKIAIFADSVLLSDNPAKGLATAAEKFKSNEGVESAEFNGNVLAVKYKNGGYVMWLLPEPEGEEELPEIQFAKRPALTPRQAKSVTGSDIFNYPKVLIVNQQSQDESRATYNNFIRYFSYNIRENYNQNVTYVPGERFDIDFLRDSIRGYDGIFIKAHGSFYKNNAWIATGDESISDFTYLFDGSKTEEQWQNEEIAYAISTETRNGESVRVKHLLVSENFFADSYPDNYFSSNSMIYIGACQGLMDPDNEMANTLMNKGFGKVAGYSETTLTAINTVNMYYLANGLLYGNSYDSIVSALPTQNVRQRFTHNNEVITCNLVSFDADKNFLFNPYQISKNLIYNTIPEDLVKILQDMRMPIYQGINPPQIKGSYLFSPIEMTASNITGDNIGHIFNDQKIQYSGQTGFFVNVVTLQSNTFSRSEKTVIQGEGKNFTIYLKSRAHKLNATNVYIDLAEIYSGTYDKGQIRNLSYGFVCVDDSHNDGTYVDKGSARVFLDNDFVTEPITWNGSATPSSKIAGDKNSSLPSIYSVKK